MRARFFHTALIALTTACGGGGDSGGTGPATVSSINVAAPTTSLAAGTSLQLSATAVDDGGQPVAGIAFSWSTNAESIARVGQSGLVQGLMPGAVQITASGGGRAQSIALTVTPVPIASISLSLPATALAVGQTVQAQATVRDANGGTLEGRSIGWVSENSSVATVTSTGLITAASAGTARITATAEGKSASTELTVSVPVSAVTVSPSNPRVSIGQSLQLTAVPRDAGGNALAGRAVSWSVDNGAVATVSTTGVVIGVGAGSATITAMSESQSGSIVLTVEPPLFASISASWANTCAVSATGQAYCWGLNSYGQLGNGTRTTALAPTPVAGGIRFTAVSNGPWWTCGVATDGAAYCWGWVATNDPGNATSETCTSTTCMTAPSPVRGSQTFTSISTGNSFACGIATTGLAYCWGRNALGTLGNGTRVSSLDPVLVGGGMRFVSLDVGFYEACGLLADGQAYCWGLNDYGQLGSASTSVCDGLPCVLTPQPVQTTLRFASINVGERHTCAIMDDGQGFCWGINSSGQLGDGTLVNRTTPTRIAGDLRFRSLAAGYGVGIAHSCGITTAGAVYCWGYNNAGQLGNGNRLNSALPSPVIGPTTFMGIAAASSSPASTSSHPHTCGILADGAAYCWGDNSVGQMGTGATTGSAVPVRVRNP
jgi:alpha-tubulin suppressor-like RCC1 family protein